MYRRSLQGKYSLAQLWTLASRYLWAFNPFWTLLNLLDISSPVYFKSLIFSLIQWYRTHIVKYFKIPCYHTLLLIKTNSKCHRLIYKCGTKCPQIFLSEVNHSNPICIPDFFRFFCLRRNAEFLVKIKLKNQNNKLSEVWNEGQNPYASRKLGVWALSVSLCVYLCIYKNKKNYFLLLLSIPFRFISEVFSQSKLIKHVYWKKKKKITLVI